MREVKAAIIGFGGIARSHKKAYEQLGAEGAGLRLTAICDINENQFKRIPDINIGADGDMTLEGVKLYTDLDDMIEKEDFELADICLPTYLHREFTVKLLNAGKHVQCEKPMSLCEADCAEMIAAARANDRRLMIGQCLRFEPQYLYIKKLIDEGTYGRVKYMHMDRLSSLPLWGFNNWFRKTECSGGCAMDLHVHDVDMVRFLFGEPKAVSAVAYDDITRWQLINSRFCFDDGKVITANGSWDEARTKKFDSSFRVRFERAEAVQTGGVITVYPDEGEVFTAEYEHRNRMAEELRMIASLIADPGAVNTTNPPESAMKTVALVKRLCESADDGGKVIEL